MREPQPWTRGPLVERVRRAPNRSLRVYYVLESDPTGGDFDDGLVRRFHDAFYRRAEARACVARLRRETPGMAAVIRTLTLVVREERLEAPGFAPPAFDRVHLEDLLRALSRKTETVVRRRTRVLRRPGGEERGGE